jgi:shikimate dehydrogenase
MIRACVIGYPVAHSRSPLIHGHWLAAYGVDGLYAREAAPPDAFAAFVRSMPERGYAGGNCTLPHKEAALALCAEVDAGARRIGAVNTLWWEAGALHGENTDWRGYAASLDEEAPGWDRAGGPAIVIGAGGAARAVLFALLERGFDRVFVANRDAARAGALADAFGPRVTPIDLASVPGRLGEARLLVNTTSLGMEGQPPLALDLAGLPEDAVVSDIVYTPLETALVAAARARGLRAVGGLGMLLHQAAPGFERWFGRRPEVTPALRALIEADVLGAARG